MRGVRCAPDEIAMLLYQTDFECNIMNTDARACYPSTDLSAATAMTRKMQADIEAYLAGCRNRGYRLRV